MAINGYKADLHMHSTCSDGKFSPTELVHRAKNYGISCIAITDHDTMDGVDEAEEAGVKLGVEIIPGVEVTAVIDGRESHVLCYGADRRNAAWRTLLKKQRTSRLERASQMLVKLQEMGILLNMEDIRKTMETDVITRPHIAQALVREGHAYHTSDAFAKYIGNTAPAYVPLQHIEVEDLISQVHAAGGVAVMAHPGSLYNAEQLGRIVGWGIDGFEFLHPSHTYRQQVYYRELAQNNGLVTTAGSDFHGYRFQDFSHYGYVVANEAAVLALKARIQGIKEVFVALES